MPATLAHFAKVNDAAAVTTKKLQKQAILAEYFRGLDESSLRLAVRYAAGRAFAATDERVLNVGGAIVWDVTIAIVGLDMHAFHDLVINNGEIGEAIAKVWPTVRGKRVTDEASIFTDGSQPCDSSICNDRELTLNDLSDAFDQLAATGIVEQKRSILFDLFTRCQTGRQAAYLAKIIFGDLRTGVQEGVLQAAIAKAFDKTLPQIQRCQLLAGDLDEVAVLAKNNALDVVAFRLFHPIQFMLATPQETAQIAAETIGGRSFYVEDKLDGIRAQVHKSADRIVIYTRTMDRTDESFPDVVKHIAALPGDFLLDGEIVPWRDGCVLPFAHLQKRLGRKKLTAAMLRENPAEFIAFDILYRDGTLLMDSPLRVRRRHLEDLAARSVHPLLISSSTEVGTADQIEAAFAAARQRRNEGIVLKDPVSSYAPGRRGQAWLKLKTHLPTFDCVVTAAEYGNGKRKSVLSDYTFAVWSTDSQAPDARLLNIGKAYSGVTDEEISQLTKLFLAIATEKHGRVYRVPPQVVLEIACDQIQKSDRHESGYALRFPRIKRIRWDKRPEEADTVQRVAETYESSPNFGKSVALGASPKELSLFDC